MERIFGYSNRKFLNYYVKISICDCMCLKWRKKKLLREYGILTKKLENINFVRLEMGFLVLIVRSINRVVFFLWIFGKSIFYLYIF